MELVVPKGMVYDNTELRTRVIGDSSDISFDYVLDIGRNPLHSFCNLSIGVRHLPVADTTKYYVVQKAGRWSASVGGKYQNGWVKAKVRTLGTFAVAVDTVAPRITPLGQGSWRTTRNIRFKITDGQTGIQSYKVYVDGNFVLFGLKKVFLSFRIRGG